MLLFYCSKFVSAQFYNNDYAEVFYIQEISNNKNIVFQNYWFTDFTITDSTIKAQRLRSIKTERIDNKEGFTHHTEYIYDNAGRNTFLSELYLYNKRYRHNYSFMFTNIYKHDTGRSEGTSYSMKNGKLHQVFRWEKLSDTTNLEIYRDGKMATNSKRIHHINANKDVYYIENYEGPREKFLGNTYYEYYINHNIKSVKQYNPKGKLSHSWMYMDCGTTPSNNNHKTMDTINICRSSSYDKDSNLHQYITYTSVKGVQYKHEKISDKSGIVKKHFTINQKTGHYYNLGETYYTGDTLCYAYTKYRDRNGKPSYKYIYSFVGNKKVAYDYISYNKKGKENNHYRYNYFYDKTGKIVKHINTSFTYKKTTESNYTYHYY